MTHSLSFLGISSRTLLPNSDKSDPTWQVHVKILEEIDLGQLSKSQISRAVASMAPTVRLTRALRLRAWYAKARKLDLQRGTRLGTLGYLPWEVRRHIWALLIERGISWPYVARLNNGNLFHFFASRPVPYNSFANPNSNKNSKVIEIEYQNHNDNRTRVSYLFRFRNVSLTVKYEFDAMLFSTRILHFNCPYSLRRFIAQLSPFQRRHFFHLSINLFTRCRCCPPYYFGHEDLYISANKWLIPLISLPLGLRNVFVDIGDKNIRRPIGECLFPLVSLSFEYRGISKKRFLETMEIFLCRAKRCVPNATFSLKKWHLQDVYQGAFGEVDSIFNQLDNYRDENIPLIARFAAEETEVPIPASWRVLNI